jgi:low affinity Fe/Cu permease
MTGHEPAPWHTRATSTLTTALGSVPAIAGALILIVVWVLMGPVFSFSDTWQLVINTTTTIITFIMVFVIQNTTNRESRATNVKLDALLRCADPSMADPEVRKLLGIEERAETDIKAEQDEVRRDKGGDS